MAKLGLILCGAMLIAIPGAARTGQKKRPPARKTPAPIWTTPLPWPAKAGTADQLALHGDVVLACAEERWAIAAFDRKTGRELWHRVDDAEIRRRESSRPLEKSEPLVERARAARIPWGETYELAGASADGTVTLLNVTRLHTEPAPNKRLGFDLERTDVVQGIESRSGNVVWERKAPPIRRDRWGRWVLSLVVKATSSNLAVLYTPERLLVVDARTGKELPTPDERRAVISGPEPDPRVVFPMDEKLDLYRPVRGRELRFQFGTQFLISVDRVGDRIIADVDSDSGALGGSTYPKYLAGFDLAGEKRWNFPPRAVYDREGVRRTPDVTGMHSIQDAGVVIGGNLEGLYGVRAIDGRKLWHRPLPYVRLAAAYGKRLLTVAEPRDPRKEYPGHDALAAIDAITGAVRWLARIPRTRALLPREGTLYLGGWPTNRPLQGQVEAYRLADFGIR